MKYICKKCGGEGKYVSLYDEEGVDGIECGECDIRVIEGLQDDFYEIE